MEERDRELQDVFTAYRGSFPDPDPSANFMPGVWSRIEKRRRENLGMRLIARRLLLTACSMGLALGLLVVVPQHSNAPLSTTYLERLEEENLAPGVDAALGSSDKSAIKASRVTEDI